MPAYTLNVIKDTSLRQKLISNESPDQSGLQPLNAGKVLVLHSYIYDQESRHYRVAFLTDSFQGRNTWWAFEEHVEIARDGVVIPQGEPEEKKLDVKWRSQLDNLQNPYGSCNVTSVAMCLNYLGHPDPDGEQLEDELYQHCEDHGLNRHLPADLATLIQRYGYADDLQMNGQWKDIKPWLNKGNPVIVHGDFTDSGHIVVIIGYNARGWIVNDPYGEWFSDGYDTNASSAGLTYSYGMMERICHSSGDLWIHYVYKP